VELKIPPGSDSGSKLRLAERGLPGAPVGDQYVTLRVVLPKAESAQARKLCEQMASEMPFDPRVALDKALET
jgi:curved DNA-binding protein